MQVAARPSGGLACNETSRLEPNAKEGGGLGSKKAGPQKGKQRPDHNFEKGGTRAGCYKTE